MQTGTSITAIVLTFNEAANIERTLGQLGWVRRIVVVDSGSTDETQTIVAKFPNAQLCHRPFDNFAAQCNHALEHMDIDTEWILSLDADYYFPEELGSEICETLRQPPPDVVGYYACFSYAIQGIVIRSGIYPRRLVLYRHGTARYVMDGHAHRVCVDGPTGQLRHRIVHDDRKPLQRWLTSQAKYAAQEARLISEQPANELRRSRAIRKWFPLTPWLVFVHCLFVRGGILDGRSGWLYALERMIAELLVQYELTRRRISGKSPEELRTQSSASNR